jgi:hypothetical protein
MTLGVGTFTLRLYSTVWIIRMNTVGRREVKGITTYKRNIDHKKIIISTSYMVLYSQYLSGSSGW